MQQHQSQMIDLTVIKSIFLKYFELSTTLESRLNTLDTLCSVLQTTEKERESLQLYKKKVVERETAIKDNGNKGNQGKPIQEKFYSFLARTDDD